MPESQHEAAGQWAIYEANVQSYRGLALSSQSLFLAVGAILLSARLEIPFFAIMLLAMVTTWYIWFPVIFARTAIVDYYKFHLAQKFDRDGKPFSISGRDPATECLVEKEYARTTNFRLRAEVYSHFTASDSEPFRTMRLTRKKIDLYLPAFLTIVWFIFGIFVLVVG